MRNLYFFKTQWEFSQLQLQLPLGYTYIDHENTFIRTRVDASHNTISDSRTDFINLDLLGWEEAPEDKKMKVKE